MNEPFDLRTFQLRLLDILTEVDKACQTHHIRYYLVAGTLLGAVRHKGFIPWDDDIDIAMPRPDYERFLRHAHEWLPAPLEMVAPECTKHYPFAFAKVQDSHTTLLERRKLQYIGGLCIDIFPLDGLPSGQLKQWWNYRLSHFYEKLLYFVCRDPYKHGSGLRAFPSLLCRKCLNPDKLQRAIKQVRSHYDYNACDYLIDNDFPLKRGVAPKALYGEGKPILFEGRTFNGVSQPDAVLRLIYGNYMEIPPHNQQKQHRYRVVQFDKPYREYNGEL